MNPGYCRELAKRSDWPAELSHGRFQSLVATLDDRTACLLWLCGFRSMSLRKAGATIGLSLPESRRLTKRAIRRLRQLPADEQEPGFSERVNALARMIERARAPRLELTN